jgi:alkylhydroperoxidase/carboxymuconolactone decarboxylase family protein YurZ
LWIHLSFFNRLSPDEIVLFSSVDILEQRRISRMVDKSSLVSDAFKAFLTNAPDHAKAWGDVVQTLAKVSALDRKTLELAYIAVLAALNRVSGVPFHVITAKKFGATRDEVISAVLIGLPAAGHVVTQSLPCAIEAYDKS